MYDAGRPDQRKRPGTLWLADVQPYHPASRNSGRLDGKLTGLSGPHHFGRV